MPKEPLTHRISDVMMTTAGVTFAVMTITLDALNSARRLIVQSIKKR